jgi:uncharacterized protein with HEPN domain
MDSFEPSSVEKLVHISTAIEQILKFCDGKTEADFLSDDMLSSSVLYQFIIIGEAIQFVDHKILKKHPYPWHLPRSFRNYIAHECFGMNLKQVFKTVTDLLPDFKVLVDRMIEQER